ncbi:uncharacterized protein znf638 [Syngnathoides biaculeatus]|uniref:uncharacterized protein znf638 n=1 Tax=Syngnathoides biaculeatus TaxID=300417 RepID=UPI002ADDFCFB|nr:uncharacterized protein znf638 [Syngnathoides biaculeatus]XP_061664943.1 uncharacterized protein znf638 [Syngnathoides biaculeatus]
MSRPQYNPYAPEPRDAERDTRTTSTLVGLGPGLGTTAGGSRGSGSMAIPSLVPNYRPKQRAKTNDDIQTLAQVGPGRELLSPGAAANSYQNSSRRSDGGGSSFNCLSSYDQATADDTSAFYHPLTLPGRSSFSASGEEDRDLRSISGHHYDKRNVAQSSEPAQPKFTSETAANILGHFGLEKDDLEHLISYPEDQITPANLPFILRQIRIQKSKKGQSKPIPEPAPARGDNWGSPGLGGIKREDKPSTLLQSSTIIDYGHTSKYAGRVEVNFESRAERAEGDNQMTVDSLGRRSGGQELVQQAGRSPSLVPSSLDQQASSSSFFTSNLTSATPKIPTKQAPSSAQSMFPSFPLLAKDIDGKDVKSQAPNPPYTFDRVQAAPKPTVKQHRGVHCSRPGLVVLGSYDYTGGTDDQFNSQSSAMTEMSLKQRKPTQQQNIKTGQQQKQESTRKPPQVKKQQQQQQQAPKTPLKPQPANPTPRPAVTEALLPTPPQLTQMTWQQGFTAAQDFHPIPPTFPSFSSRPALPSFASHLRTGAPCLPQPQAQMSASTDLQTTAMMLDYVAATPRVFPHTCSLCKKRCALMKDWLDHQNSTLHLESCKVFSKKYPQWDAEGSNFLKDKEERKSALTPQSPSQKPLRSDCSSSRRRRSSSSDPVREKRRRTRSRSPHSSRYRRRSRSHSSSSSDYGRSHPRSYERRPVRRSQDDQQQSSSSGRSRERTSSRRRSSSRGHDKGPSPKRTRERRLPSKRSREGSRDPPNTQQTSTRAESLAKKLLESSAVQSLSEESDMEAMVKTLAPALLAELAKLKTARSSSSKGTAASASTAASAANKKPVGAKSTGGRQKTSSEKTEAAKASVPTIVTLGGVPSSLSYGDIVAVAEQYGKTKSVVLFRARREAIVCYETQKDAEKLRKTTNLTVQGWPISIVEDKESLPGVQKTHPQKNCPAASKASKTQLSKSTSAVPGAKGKAKSVLSKQTTETVKKAETSKVKLRAGAVRKKVNAAVEQHNAVAETTEPELAEMVEAPQQGGAESELLTEDVSRTEAGPCSAAEERNQQGTAPQVEPTEVPVPLQGDARDAEGTAEQQQAETLTDAAFAEEAVTPCGSDAAVKDDAAAPRPPNAIVKEDVMAPHGHDAAVKEDAGAPRDSDAAVEENTAAPSGPDATVVEDAVAPSGSEDAVAPSGPDAAVVEDAVAPSGPDAAVVEDAVATSGPDAAVVEDGVAPSGPDAAVEEDGVAPSGPDAAVEEDAVAPSGPDAAVAPCSSYAAETLTVGERMKEHLLQERIPCIKYKNYYKGKNHLLITNLPEDVHSYTEQDVVDLIKPFGMASFDENIYIIPQTKMAFVRMTDAFNARDTKKASKGKRLTLGASRLKLHVDILRIDLPMLPAGFYQTVMKMMCCPVTQFASRTVFIKSISLGDAASLREALRKINGVQNFMPLLNKVFVEFESDCDADRLGVWYFLQDRCPAYQLHRLGTPRSVTAPPPRHPEKAMPDGSAAAVLTFQFGIPQGTTSPFYLPMRSKPYLFVTHSPWFVIPEFLTIREAADIDESARHHSGARPTIMLTGLPEQSYKHEDVARHVRPHMDQKDLRGLNSNVSVLPLQRRAFVHFSEWDACCQFLRSHLKKAVAVHHQELSAHFVLQPMRPEHSEEGRYASLMRLSYSHVGEAESLAERLLCVEISETQKITIQFVLYLVSRHATFVNFLPLANRIFIEMADSAGVTRVLEKSKDFSPLSPKDHDAWRPVQRFESVKCLNLRLRDENVTLSNLGTDGQTEAARPPSAGSASPAVQSADAETPPKGFTSAPPEKERPAQNDGQEVESLIAVHDDISVMAEDGPACASSRGDGETRLPPVCGNIAAALREPDEARPVKEETVLEQEDLSAVSSSAFLFDGEPFNMDDFVTVDEVCDFDDSVAPAEAPSLCEPASLPAEPCSASKRAKASTSPKESKSCTVSSPSSTRATRSSSRRNLSSGSLSESPQKSTRAQSKAKKSNNSCVTVPFSTALEEENFATVPSEECFQVLDSVGEDQKAFSDVADSAWLDVTGGGAPERDDGSPLGSFDKERTRSMPKGEEQDDRGGEKKEMDDADGEQLAESCQTVEGPPSVELDKDVVETSSCSLGKEDAKAAGRDAEEEEEEGEEEGGAAAYQVIDSVEEQPASIEEEHNVPEASKSRVASTSRARTPAKKQALAAAAAAHPEPEEYLVVDALQVDRSSGAPAASRRRSTRGKTQEKRTQTLVKDEDVTFHVIDSVEEEPKVTTRGKRGRPPKTDTPSEDRVPLAKRTSPAGSSHQTAKEEPPMKTKAVVEQEPTCQVQNQEKVPAAPKGKGRKGRTRKEVKRRKMEETDKGGDEEDVTMFKILDSVEDETGQDLPSAEHTQNGSEKKDLTDDVSLEDEDEVTYQVVDSLEEEAGVTEVSGPVKPEEGQTRFAARSDHKLESGMKEPEETETETETPQRPPLTPTRARKDQTLPLATGTLTLDQVSDEEEGFFDDVAVKEQEQEREDDGELVGVIRLLTEETGEERAEGELALVTLDEIALEHEEASGQRQTEDRLNPETLLTLDETGDDDEEEEAAKKGKAAQTSHAAECKRSDDAADNATMVTLDHVGHVEEDIFRCAVEKRHNLTSERISTGTNQDGTEAAASPGVQSQEEKKEATAVRGSQQKLGKGKRIAELTLTAAKRSRSESPCGTPAFGLPAFKPNNPLGTEFIVPKSGYFCDLCSVFYLKESTAKEVHCSSKRHYDNLKKYYHECEEDSRASTQGFVSD